MQAAPTNRGMDQMASALPRTDYINNDLRLYTGGS